VPPPGGDGLAMAGIRGDRTRGGRWLARRSGGTLASAGVARGGGGDDG
jgi:hypothetical protein